MSKIQGYLVVAAIALVAVAAASRVPMISKLVFNE